MKFNQQELDLLKHSVLFYGNQYGLHGTPEYERLLQKISTVQQGPAPLRRITNEAVPTWKERNSQ